MAYVFERGIGSCLWSNGAKDVVTVFLENLQQPEPEASIRTSPDVSTTQRNQSGAGLEPMTRALRTAMLKIVGIALSMQVLSLVLEALNWNWISSDILLVGEEQAKAQSAPGKRFRVGVGRATLVGEWYLSFVTQDCDGTMPHKLKPKV